MRDIIRLFADRESRDELGLGQIRDAIADSLFPGTSTLLTRARYLLFVPWAYMKASSRPNPAADADRYERDIIHAIKDAGDYAGLLGMQAGEALKNLPSVIYWSMLRHYGILSDASLSRDDALRLDGLHTSPDDLGESGSRFHAWSTTLPSAPGGVPEVDPRRVRASSRRSRVACAIGSLPRRPERCSLTSPSSGPRKRAARRGQIRRRSAWSARRKTFSPMRAPSRR